VNFSFYRFRFHFEAAGSLYFPEGKSANILRGAFGAIFRKLACVPTCRDVATCEIRATCPYAKVFEPRAAGRSGPSGLADWPRPFVFRAAHLDGRVIEPGARFHFDVHLFDVRDPSLVYFVLTFAQLAREGLGPRRGRARLTGVEQLHLDDSSAGRVYDGETFLLKELYPPSVLTLDPPPTPVTRVTVRFVTPTELKSAHELTPRPEFAILFARLRDRLSTLRALYGSGPLEIDFRAMGDRAAQVRMTRCDLRRTQVDRRSSRTGQLHPLGGFLGEADYEGDLIEFVPYLAAGRWIGVGRQTVWGKGEMQAVHPL